MATKGTFIHRIALAAVLFFSGYIGGAFIVYAGIFPELAWSNILAVALGLFGFFYVEIKGAFEDVFA